MTEDTFRTISCKAEGLYKSRGSKFLAFGYPVSSEQEIKNIITGIRKKYHNAKHCCYAYRIGSINEISRMNDDGEPSNTAGKPIYRQIISNNLTNILIIVVRYFGGTLLGKGGLIKAYKSAATDMLLNADIIIRTFTRLYKIDFDYSVMSEVLRILDREKLEQLENKYDQICSVKIRISTDKEDNIISRLRRINSVEVSAIKDDLNDQGS
ncbi:MAG: YigZ family protein [Bacteroidales bacterium]|nr:MAG: YigZ family protein [Bacteroidales bacterium]